MSGWSDALGVVARLAPTIASVIGGPLAGGAVTALESVFGIDANKDASLATRQDALAAALSGATPEQLASVRKADQDYAARMAEAGFKNIETLAGLTVQDTISARDMLVSTKSWVPAALTAALTVGFFGMLSMLMFVNVPDANKAIVYAFTGTLGTAWLAAVHFWFGETMSSKSKDDVIANSTVS
jgi:hypothetical protein